MILAPQARGTTQKILPILLRIFLILSQDQKNAMLDLLFMELW